MGDGGIMFNCLALFQNIYSQFPLFSIQCKQAGWDTWENGDIYAPTKDCFNWEIDSPEGTLVNPVNPLVTAGSFIQQCFFIICFF